MITMERNSSPAPGALGDALPEAVLSLAMPCLHVKAGGLGMSQGSIGDALFQPGPAPIPKVMVIFWSP